MRFPSTTRECGCFLAQRRNYTNDKLVRAYRVDMWVFNPRTAQLSNNSNIRALHLVDERPMREARQQWFDVCTDPARHGCPGKEANELERKKIRELLSTEKDSEPPRTVDKPKTVAPQPEAFGPRAPVHIITPQKREPHFNYRTGNWEDGYGNRIENPMRTVEPLASGEEWAERQRIAKEKFDKGKR